MAESNQESKYPLSMISIGILVVFLVLVFFLYKKAGGKDGGIVFPAGLNYTGEEAQAPTQPARPNYDWSKIAASTTNWTTFASVQKQYSFQHPAELYPLVFPGWEADGVTFDVSEAPAQFNIMVLVEKISDYNSAYAGNLEAFVRNYWKSYGGLKGLNEIEEFTTESGLKGFKANYQTKGGGVAGDNYFFPIPGDNDKVLHVGNVFPAEANTVFMRMLNTFSFDIPTPQPTKAQ